ncbi:hypothetical protein PLICRDRAFT_110866 [Plicaturopsis crispa FD-325 SS-3]|nr:hypothetical protein PLICRDRAFT_110866 [Plicaturopsis crispa FD-325 SS-3]
MNDTEVYTDEIRNREGTCPLHCEGRVRSLTYLSTVTELAFKLLTSLPRSRLAGIQRRIAPLLQFDLVGALPIELALQIFSYLSADSLLECTTINRRWRVLADDQTLWKDLCHERGWRWKTPSKIHEFDAADASAGEEEEDDDEGMGDEEDDDLDDPMDVVAAYDDSAFASMSTDLGAQTPPTKPRNRHSAPSILPSLTPSVSQRPNYKLLYLTHTRLRARVRGASYRLSALPHAHTSTIYCLQLYTHPVTGEQTLFTGSKDRTIREWDLARGGIVKSVISGVHEGSVLSVCVSGGYIASGGSDRRVAVWELEGGRLVGVINDHEDSVLCVRFDEQRLVSCSKDRTVRTYKFPELTPQLVLGAHRAAVNAVSINHNLIVSGSGDRSVRLWDATSGKLLRTFENHHSRGIASIDFKPPFVLSGSSDKHLRLFDVVSLQGWSTAPPPLSGAPVCQACGSATAGNGGAGATAAGVRCVHGDLVRSVALGEDFIVSGSYDQSIKVWERKTGSLVADLTGGHTGRIFCVGFDCTKIVSCGEDQVNPSVSSAPCCILTGCVRSVENMCLGFLPWYRHLVHRAVTVSASVFRRFSSQLLLRCLVLLSSWSGLLSVWHPLHFRNQLFLKLASPTGSLLVLVLFFACGCVSRFLI